jgi:hypothetical protein
MPALMIFGSLLFVATAALFLLPVLMAMPSEIASGPVWMAEWKTIAISVAAIGIAAALQHDRASVAASDAGTRDRASRLADRHLHLLAGFLTLTVYAFALGNSGLWLLGIGFAIVQCVVDPRRP